MRNDMIKKKIMEQYSYLDTKLGLHLDPVGESRYMTEIAQRYNNTKDKGEYYHEPSRKTTTT